MSVENVSTCLSQPHFGMKAFTYHVSGLLFPPPTTGREGKVRSEREDGTSPSQLTLT